MKKIVHYFIFLLAFCMQTAEAQNFYDILGIKKDASAQEIKSAYYALTKKYHPDANKSSEATKQFQKINDAHATLKDSLKRNQYDQTLIWPAQQSHTSSRTQYNANGHQETRNHAEQQRIREENVKRLTEEVIKQRKRQAQVRQAQAVRIFGARYGGFLYFGAFATAMLLTGYQLYNKHKKQEEERLANRT